MSSPSIDLRSCLPHKALHHTNHSSLQRLTSPLGLESGELQLPTLLLHRWRATTSSQLFMYTRGVTVGWFYGSLLPVRWSVCRHVYLALYVSRTRLPPCMWSSKHVGGVIWSLPSIPRWSFACFWLTRHLACGVLCRCCSLLTLSIADACVFGKSFRCLALRLADSPLRLSRYVQAHH